MDRFERLMDPIDTSNAFKWLKIRFESSSMVHTNVTTFEVAVGATVLEVEVEVEDRYQWQVFFDRIKAHVHSFQNHII
jgi:hypothetical protein